MERQLLLECEIPTRCRPLKNSRQIIMQGGRRLIIPSKEYLAWSKIACQMLQVAKGRSRRAFPHDGPIHVEAKFYYDRSPADLDNALASISEVLQKVCVVIDDQLISSYDGSRRFKCTRGKSRTYVKVYTFEETTDG